MLLVQGVQGASLYDWALINFKLDETVACKGIQDSLGFCIPRRVLRIPGAGF